MKPNDADYETLKRIIRTHGTYKTVLSLAKILEDWVNEVPDEPKTLRAGLRRRAEVLYRATRLFD